MKYLVFGITAIFLALCSKVALRVQSPLDYLIFGHFYGETVGEDCIEIYKLTDQGLYKDVSDSYLVTEFDFSPMGMDQFDVARKLKQALPSLLMNSTESSFGCPDCYDQGGMYIEISTNGESRSWCIDQDKRMVPGYLHFFMDEVNQVIDAIHPL